MENNPFVNKKLNLMRCPICDEKHEDIAFSFNEEKDVYIAICPKTKKEIIL